MLVIPVLFKTSILLLFVLTLCLHTFLKWETGFGLFMIKLSKYIIIRFLTSSGCTSYKTTYVLRNPFFFSCTFDKQKYTNLINTNFFG